MTNLRKLSAKTIELLVDIHEKGQIGMPNRNCHSGTKTLESRGYVFQTSSLRRSVQWHITSEGEKYLVDAPLVIKGDINIIFDGENRGFNSLKHFDWWCKYQEKILNSSRISLCGDISRLRQELREARSASIKFRGVY